MAATNPKKSEEVQPKRLRKNETKHVLVANTEQPHQVMSAAQAMLLVLLTLLVGTLLNSSSLYTHATTMKPDLYATHPCRCCILLIVRLECWD